jgi:hypothetical protein
MQVWFWITYNCNIVSLDVFIDIHCGLKNESDCVKTSRRIKLCSS